MSEQTVDRTGTWTEDTMFDLARIMFFERYGPEGATQEDVDKAVWAAIRRPGCPAPVGSTGRTVTLTPGVKERFGIVSRTG
jgi:hypothetical protein